MKRPVLEYIGNHKMKDKYISELEKYCDELEEIISKDDCITHYEKEIQRLEKTQIE